MLRFRPEGEGSGGSEGTGEGEVIEIDLEEVIGGILDSRGLTKDNLTALEKLNVLDGLEDLFKKHTPKQGKGFDSDGFLKTVSDLMDSKLEGIGNGKPKKQDGWLTRFLSGTTA